MGMAGRRGEGGGGGGRSTLLTLKPIRARVEHLVTNSSECRTVVQKATNQPQNHAEETQVNQREKQSSER